MALPPTVDLAINFPHLRQALIEATTEYLKPTLGEKIAATLKQASFFKKFPCILGSSAEQGQNRARNLGSVVRLLNPGTENARVLLDQITEDQLVLLKLADALLGSTSKKLRRLVLPKLLDLIPDPATNGFTIGSFGNKAFYYYPYQLNGTALLVFSRVFSSSYYSDKNAASIFILTANLQRLPNAPHSNRQAIDRLLTQPPANSPTKVPLLFLSIKKKRTGTLFDPVPTDVVKIMIQYAKINARSAAIAAVLSAN